MPIFIRFLYQTTFCLLSLKSCTSAASLRALMNFRNYCIPVLQQNKITVFQSVQLEITMIKSEHSPAHYKFLYAQ